MWKNIKKYFDRNYNILFNKKYCVKILFSNNPYKYNDILETADEATDVKYKLRYLGNGWCKIINDKKKKPFFEIIRQDEIDCAIQEACSDINGETWYNYNYINQ